MLTTSRIKEIFIRQMPILPLTLGAGLGAAGGLAQKAGVDPKKFLHDYAGFVGDAYKGWGDNIGGFANQVKGAVGDVSGALFPTPYGAEGQLIESDNPLLRHQGTVNLNRSDISDALFPGY